MLIECIIELSGGDDSLNEKEENIMNTTNTKRYRMTYIKGAMTIPCSRWVNTPEEAERLAEQYRKVGYLVNIWEYDKDGAHPYKQTLKDLFAAC